MSLQVTKLKYIIKYKASYQAVIKTVTDLSELLTSNPKMGDNLTIKTTVY